MRKEPAGQNHLLPIAAAEAFNRRFYGRGFDPQLLRKGFCHAAFFSAIDHHSPQYLMEI
ncbi:hypothetical protein D3C83_195440 [compost metagenome]